MPRHFIDSTQIKYTYFQNEDVKCKRSELKKLKKVRKMRRSQNKKAKPLPFKLSALPDFAIHGQDTQTNLF